MTQLNNYRVLITGAFRGIGKALAHEFAKLGVEILLLSRNINDLQKTASELSIYNSKIHYMKCDVSDKEDVRKAVEFCEMKLGGVDLALLNAGTGTKDWFTNYNSDEVVRVFQVNVFGATYFFEYLIPLMMKQGGGSIAGVSSQADFKGSPGSSSYGASKSALSLMLEAARIELKEYGIKVFTIRPGFIRTDMTAKHKYHMPLLMDVDKAAQIIIKKILKGKTRIYFPRRLAVITFLIKIIPTDL